MTRVPMAGRHVRMSPPVARRGSVLMEFVLAFPLIILLVSMLLQFAQIWIAREITAYAAYCATRATLACSSGEEKTAAKRAAETVCAWMCLAGLSTDPASASGGGESAETHWDKFHNLTEEVAETDVVEIDTDAARPDIELEVPGWGTVPGSSSRHARVDVEVRQGGESKNYAAVKVTFRFPLVLPLAGRMISWLASKDRADEDPSQYDHETGTWTGDSHYSVHGGWHRGRETVMADDGTMTDREMAVLWEGRLFPVIELTETCVLPRPYLTTDLPADAYDYSGGGGA